MARKVECLPYRISLTTTRPPDDVLADLGAQDMVGVGATERGTHYVLLEDRRRPRYGPDLAVGLGIAILLAVLIGYAFHPLIIALLPLALAPGIPLLVRDHRTLVAIGAVVESDGMTRVTAHGQVSRELAAALDGYFGSLPPPDASAVASGPPPAPAAMAR